MGSKVSASIISELNKKAYVHIEAWRNRPLQGGKYPYVYQSLDLDLAKWRLTGSSELVGTSHTITKFVYER